MPVSRVTNKVHTISGRVLFCTKAKRYKYSSGPKDTEFWVKCSLEAPWNPWKHCRSTAEALQKHSKTSKGWVMLNCWCWWRWVDPGLDGQQTVQVCIAVCHMIFNASFQALTFPLLCPNSFHSVFLGTKNWFPERYHRCLFRSSGRDLNDEIRYCTFCSSIWLVWHCMTMVIQVYYTNRQTTQTYHAPRMIEYFNPSRRRRYLVHTCIHVIREFIGQWCAVLCASFMRSDNSLDWTVECLSWKLRMSPRADSSNFFNLNKTHSNEFPWYPLATRVLASSP